MDTVATIDYSGLPQQLDPAILGQKISMAASVDQNPSAIGSLLTNPAVYRQVNWAATKHEVLSSDETPRVGTIVSIDAEFVALQQVCAALLKPECIANRYHRRNRKFDQMEPKRS